MTAAQLAISPGHVNLISLLGLLAPFPNHLAEAGEAGAEQEYGGRFGPRGFHEDALDELGQRWCGLSLARNRLVSVASTESERAFCQASRACSDRPRLWCKSPRCS